MSPYTVRVSGTKATEKKQWSEATAFYSQGAQLPSPLGRYVEGIVHLFYHGDDIVRGDPELQAWCREITEVGLCQAQDRGEISPQRIELLRHSAQSPLSDLPFWRHDTNLASPPVPPHKGI